MNRLLEIADAEYITIEYRKLTRGLNGFYIWERDCPPYIALSFSLNSNYRLHRCVLAEELGHHFTSIGQRFSQKHHSLQDRLTIDKIEYKALRSGQPIFLYPKMICWMRFAMDCASSGNWPRSLT